MDLSTRWPGQRIKAGMVAYFDDEFVNYDSQLSRCTDRCSNGQSKA